MKKFTVGNRGHLCFFRSTYQNLHLLWIEVAIVKHSRGQFENCLVWTLNRKNLSLIVQAPRQFFCVSDHKDAEICIKVRSLCRPIRQCVSMARVALHCKGGAIAVVTRCDFGNLNLGQSSAGQWIDGADACARRIQKGYWAKINK